MTRTDLERILTVLLTRHRHQAPRVDSVETKGDTFIANVRFARGDEYCCAEPGCHFGLGTTAILEIANDLGISISDDLVIEWHVTGEEGCRFTTWSRRVRTGFQESKRFEYVATSRGPTTE